MNKEILQRVQSSGERFAEQVRERMAAIGERRPPDPQQAVREKGELLARIKAKRTAVIAARDQASASFEAEIRQLDGTISRLEKELVSGLSERDRVIDSMQTNSDFRKIGFSVRKLKKRLDDLGVEGREQLAALLGKSDRELRDDLGLPTPSNAGVFKRLLHQALGAGGSVAGTSGARPSEPALDVIKGLGPRRRKKLREAGIVDLGDLAASDSSRLQELLRVSAEQAETWIEKARQLERDVQSKT